MQAEFGPMKMCHMIADSSEELLAMAEIIGVKQKWIQYKGTYREHFDICKSKKILAIKAGAVEVTQKQIALMLRAKRLGITKQMPFNDYVYTPAIAFDTETHLMGMGNLAPKLVCISTSIKDDGKMQSAVHATADQPCGVDETIDMIVFGDLPFRFVAHNTCFDLAVLAFRRPELLPAIFKGLTEGRFEDTIIREKLLHLATHGDPEYAPLPGGQQMKITYNLGDMAKRYLGVDRSEAKDATLLDSWRTNFYELESLPVAEWPKGAARYVMDDSEDCLGIREMQEKHRADVWKRIGHDPFSTQDFQVSVSFALYLMSCYGFATDPVAKAKIEAMLAEELDPKNLQALIKAEILIPATPPRPHKTNPGKFTQGTDEKISQTRLKEFVSVWARENNVKLMATPKGDISLSGDWFAEYKDRHPIFAEYHKRQTLQKLVSTELPRMNWPTDSKNTAAIVHPCFDVLKSTGRTSSFASKIYPSFNCQNVDPRVRGCFVPRPGYLYCSADYSGMELCTLAQKVYNLFGHSVHRDKINAGIDNHTYLGSQLAYALDASFKSACDAAQARTPEAIYDAFAKCKSHSNDEVKALFKKYRKFAKPTGLGYPGGLGAKTFVAFAKGSYGVAVTEEEAATLKEIWKSTYPEMQMYFDWITKNCVDPWNEPDFDEETGKETAKFAYTTPFGMYIAGARFCAIANGAGLQAFSAEGAKLAVFNVVRACYDSSVGSILFNVVKPIAFIHDEILFEVPECSVAHEMCYAVGGIMEESFKVVTPDVACKAQPVLMRRWNKDAEPVFDRDGRLVVWEPIQK